MRVKVLQGVLGGLLLLHGGGAWAIGFSGTDLNGLPCHGNPQGYGPYDYTNRFHFAKKLPIVEQQHFTSDVERLIRGKSGTVVSDLDYTLRAFPNHHRALYALIRLALEPTRSKRSEVGKIQTPPECYLQRAQAFNAKDGKVELLYGLYLHRLGKHDAAESHYRAAIERMPRSAEAYYNLGLLLTDQEKFAEAVPVAKKAYRYGYPLAGLKRRLAAAGHPLTD